MLDVLNVEKDNMAERKRGAKSRSVQKTLEACDNLRFLTQKSKFFIFDL